MRIAFYAPLKPPDHPVPSGDRRMARAFVALLQSLGHEVEVASTLRSYERDGDRARQLALQTQGSAETARLVRRWRAGGERPPDLWFTYHAYHKAPDWLGPAVAGALGIPYVVAEASVAGKQAGGRWDLGHEATLRAIGAAAAVLALTRVDATNLARWLADTTKLVHFPPFLAPSTEPVVERAAARARLAAALDLPQDTVWLATVAMMRADIKSDSYALLAESLRRLGGRGWRLLVVGDGDNAAAIRADLVAAAGDQVRFLGARPAADVAPVLAAADVFVWPALREAYGMAILEALAAGLPVVACDEGGVADLVEHGGNGLLATDRSASQLAAHLGRLVADPAWRCRLGRRAAERVAEWHSPAVARARLAAVLASVAGGQAPGACG